MAKKAKIKPRPHIVPPSKHYIKKDQYAKKIKKVENTVYLIEFLKKEVEIKTNERKKLLKDSHVSGTSLSNYLKNKKTHYK